MQPIIMPQIGQDIPTGEIVEWCKAEGEQIRKGEVVVVVQSEKASFEVEAEADGVLVKVLHLEGAEVEILQPIGYIGRPGERFDEAQMAQPAAERRPQAAPAEAQPTAPAQTEGSKASASPAVRRFAREQGVDLSTVKGTGPDGRITKEDVLRAADAAADE